MRIQRWGLVTVVATIVLVLPSGASSVHAVMDRASSLAGTIKSAEMGRGERGALTRTRMMLGLRGGGPRFTGGEEEEEDFSEQALQPPAQDRSKDVAGGVQEAVAAVAAAAEAGGGAASSEATPMSKMLEKAKTLILSADEAINMGSIEVSEQFCKQAVLTMRETGIYDKGGIPLESPKDFQAAHFVQMWLAIVQAKMSFVQGEFEESHKICDQILAAYPKQQDALDLRHRCEEEIKGAEEDVYGGDEAGARTRSRSRSASVGPRSGSVPRANGTPFAGLRNEGATCYLNAVMQSLFHLPALRRAVYRMPSENPPPGEAPSTALALQRLFYRLQNGSRSQSTGELIASFGWDSEDAMLQQDISDFVHMFLDIVEEQMKNTTVEGELDRLFGIKVEYLDEAPAVNWKRTRNDTSMVTILHGVQECKDVYEAMEKQQEPEVIEGYDTEVHGKQDVLRSHRFKGLPPILLLNINRMGFDPERYEPIKLHDRFEFADEMDLSKFVSSAEEGSAAAPAGYKLASVIVHMGTAQIGHYISIVRANGEEQWMRFDDDSVVPVPEKEALEANFGTGGGGPGGGALMMGRSALERLRSAYLLVYVRSDKWDEVMNVTDIDADVPDHVIQGVVDGGYTAPQTWSVLVRDGESESRNDGGDRESSGRRGVGGRVVQVTLPGDGTSTVDSLLQGIRGACEERGTPMDVPSFEEFVGCEPELITPKWLADQPAAAAELGFPNIKEKCEMSLQLTTLSPHALCTVFPGELPLSRIDPTFLFRAEWLDVGRMALTVHVVLFEAEDGRSLDGVVGNSGGIKLRAHGDSCLISVYVGELARSVRKRALHRLGLAKDVDSSSSTGDDRQASGRVAWMVKGEQENFFLGDEDEVLADASAPRHAYFGIEMPDDGMGPEMVDTLTVNPYAATREAGKGVNLRKSA